MSKVDGIRRAAPCIIVALEIKVLAREDASVLESVAADVFDDVVDARWTREFLDDERHHLVVAIDDGVVVGFASAVHYVHPDKPPELWINEVGVAPTHQGRGIGHSVMAAVLARGRAIGCVEAWVATEETNFAARRLYTAAGGVQDPDVFVTYTFRLNQRPD
jgi:GNAT superfamily N-acetyltransferase